MSQPAPIALIGALKEELGRFLESASDIEPQPWGAATIYTAQLFGHSVVIAQSGIGKVLAACTTQRVIDLFTPGAIIFTGVAGALAPDLEVGDIIVGREFIQHDLDVRPLGFARGQIPYTEHRIIRSDARLHDIACAYAPPGHKVRSGRILTGDQFLTTADLEGHRYLTEELEGDVVEMEGASAATVAMLNQVPMVAIRTVSDRADGSAHIDFAKFLPVAAENSLGVVQELLTSIA